MGYNKQTLKRNCKGHILFILLALIVLVIVSGLRYNVGADYPGYSFIFTEQPYNDDSLGMEIEYGFVLIVDTLNNIGLEVWTFFTFTAFTTCFLLFYSFRNYKFQLYLGVFFFITYGFYFFSFNAVRQAIAMSALAVAVAFIQERKLFPFLGVILIGGLMHKSLYLFLPLYFVLDKIKLSKYIWYGAFIISLALHFIPMTSIMNISSVFNVLADSQIDYSNFLEDNNSDLSVTGSLTLGYLARVGAGFIILVYYDKLTKLNPNYFPYFTLSLIGIFMYNSFSTIFFIGRINNYFLLFHVFTLAFIIDYLFRSKQKLMANAILLYFLILFFSNIYYSDNGSAPYKFIAF
ncbi:EpsG family protein [Arenibacter echinorum]|nr:EpsG family protein [Arenibacter echinorum]